MRLSSLKLSGFKSFADSTTLQFKSNRSAVVGPNGCGKSNVIDAIRWVMGESNARQLRGGQMQDVIFTGTAKRKPVGMASVELRFENTYGKLGGAYNAYTELAVRRQVTREGRSEYFLNGTKCRRRDITDIFLGTGLGPRSYAIIEQGMISRLVDAKPDEMRVYIEEAAGVSRYQARRRETLTHLEHTTQNLLRLEDIALELKSQLKTLKKQAEAAIQYQQLEQEILRLKVEILSLQANQSLDLKQLYTAQMTQLSAQFRVLQTEFTAIEQELLSTQTVLQALIQQSEPLQQEWQSAEQHLTQIQQEYQQCKKRVAAHQEHIAQLIQQEKKYQQQLQQFDQHSQQQEHTVSDYVKQLQHIQNTYEQAQQQLQAKQDQYQQQHAEFMQLKTQVEKLQHKKEHMLAQEIQLLKNLTRTQHQQEMLQQQLNALQLQQPEQDIEDYQQQKADLDIDLLKLEQKIISQQAQLTQTQQQEQLTLQACQKYQTELKVLHAEQNNLQKLCVQTQQTQQDAKVLLDVLELHPEAKPHAALIEKFLAQWLNATLVNDFQPEQARQLKCLPIASQQWTAVQCLADWVVQPQHSLWANVGVVESLNQALALQSQLQYGQSLITLDGYHVGPDWLIGLAYDETSQLVSGGLSQRLRLEEIQQEVLQLQQQIQTLSVQHSQQQHQLEHQKQQLKRAEQQKQQYQQQSQQLQIDLAKAVSAQQALKGQQQYIQQQLKQLHVQLEEDQLQLDDLKIDVHALQIKIDQLYPQYQQQQQDLNTLKQQNAQHQQQLNKFQQQLQHLTQQLHQQQQSVALLKKDQQFVQKQLEQTQQQLADTTQQLEHSSAQLPSLEQQYEQQQQRVSQLQQQLNHWQIQLHQQQQTQDKLSQKRQQYTQMQDQQRNNLEQKRLAWQEAKTDLLHYQQQLQALDAVCLEELNICLESHQQKLLQNQQRLQKIGAVNLTANAEYNDVLLRFNQLEHQIQDLQNTVNQLQAAMKSIDQETKKLFMDTFHQINQELALLFPKVFNGGEASLSLEDDWQSGVKLMARPPGKRNSSLALLSGGEKALTALALVFAIFRLNPAPFCVLDEVDAPLDDANVARFCNLVKELSEQVQFIYITHNKLAMTMATDLLGVTMPEAGTSKLVTVNLEQAKEYSLAAEL